MPGHSVSSRRAKLAIRDSAFDVFPLPAALGQAHRAPEPAGRHVDQHLGSASGSSPIAQPVLALAGGKARKLKLLATIRSADAGAARYRPGRREKPSGS